MKRINNFIKYINQLYKYQRAMYRAYCHYRKYIDDNDTVRKLFYKCNIEIFLSFKSETLNEKIKFLYSNKPTIAKSKLLGHYLLHSEYIEQLKNDNIDETVALLFLCDWYIFSEIIGTTPQSLYFRNINILDISKSNRRVIEHYLRFFPLDIATTMEITWIDYCLYHDLDLEEEFFKMFGYRPYR